MCMLNIAFSNVMIAVKKAKVICAEISIEISGRKPIYLQDGGVKTVAQANYHAMRRRGLQLANIVGANLCSDG